MFLWNGVVEKVMELKNVLNHAKGNGVYWKENAVGSDMY
jgi:hypothetical protein